MPCSRAWRSESRVWAFIRDSGAHQWGSKIEEPHPKGFCPKTPQRESEISKWMTGRHNFTMQTIAKIETALGCKLINIAKWDLQTKGKENLSSPCFFVCADYPNTPSVRLTVWIFLSRLTLTSSSSSLRHRLSKLISALASCNLISVFFRPISYLYYPILIFVTILCISHLSTMQR